MTIEMEDFYIDLDRQKRIAEMIPMMEEELRALDVATTSLQSEGHFKEARNNYTLLESYRYLIAGYKSGRI